MWAGSVRKVGVIGRGIAPLSPPHARHRRLLFPPLARSTRRNGRRLDLRGEEEVRGSPGTYETRPRRPARPPPLIFATLEARCGVEPRPSRDPPQPQRTANDARFWACSRAHAVSNLAPPVPQPDQRPGSARPPPGRGEGPRYRGVASLRTSSATPSVAAPKHKSLAGISPHITSRYAWGSVCVGGGVWRCGWYG